MKDPSLSESSEKESREDFVAWCEKFGVDVAHKDDWGPWWDCWCKAIATYRRHIRAAVGSPLDP